MPSASTVFVDTNVLLYAHDPRDSAKQQRAAAWLQACWLHDLGRLSTQVLNEFYANLRRVAPTLAVNVARDVVMRYRAWRPWTVDESTVDIAWALQDQSSLAYWDALMLAAAQQQGCAVFLTEHLQHDQHFESLRIVNPFLIGPELLEAAI